MPKKSRASSYVACISNRGYRTSLVVRRIYRTLADPDAEKLGLVRVVDETAEDYLYPAGLFVAITVPVEVENTFKKVS